VKLVVYVDVEGLATTELYGLVREDLVARLAPLFPAAAPACFDDPSHQVKEVVIGVTADDVAFGMIRFDWKLVPCIRKLGGVVTEGGTIAFGPRSLWQGRTPDPDDPASPELARVGGGVYDPGPDEYATAHANEDGLEMRARLQASKQRFRLVLSVDARVEDDAVHAERALRRMLDTSREGLRVEATDIPAMERFAHWMSATREGRRLTFSFDVAAPPAQQAEELRHAEARLRLLWRTYLDEALVTDAWIAERWRIFQ